MKQAKYNTLSQLGKIAISAKTYFEGFGLQIRMNAGNPNERGDCGQAMGLARQCPTYSLLNRQRPTNEIGA
ncbi:MAG: hypothetical protein LBT50_06700 [Prevotellaceae bacterium]|nr:hypothetical protein [Prevotellaceae bacterium]